jgi:hypothetical protein
LSFRHSQVEQLDRIERERERQFGTEVLAGERLGVQDVAFFLGSKSVMKSTMPEPSGPGIVRV